MDGQGKTEREKESIDLSINRQVSRRQFLEMVGLAGASVAVGGGLGALLSGCGGGTGGSKSSESTKPGSSSSAAGTPKTGGTLKVMAALAAGTAGGWPASFASMSDDARPALETLIRIEKSGNIVPWLAESYQVAADSKSITFKLRKGITFHDGSVFNADAVKWNIDNVIAAKSSQFFRSVDVIDAYTAKLNLTKWSNLVWSDLYETGYTLMVSKAAFQKNGKAWMTNHPVGTGPFIFKSFQPEVGISFTRNPSYWMKDAQGQQLPHLDGVNITYIADPSTQMMTMQANQADMTDISIVDGRSATQYKDINNVIVDPIIGASLCLVPDTANADSPYSKQQVREAVDYAIDRESLANTFASGMWKGQYQIPGPASGAYSTDFAYAHKYDPAKAKQLLTAAGYPNGFSTTVVVMPIAGNGKDIYLLLKSFLAKVGINAQLLFTTSFPEYMQAVNTKRGVLNAMQLIDNNANFSVSLNFTLGTTSMFNKNWERTPEFLQLFNASLASPKADNQLIRAVTNYLSQNSMVIPLAGSGRAWAKWNYVEDLGAGTFSMPAFWRPEQVWLDK